MDDVDRWGRIPEYMSLFVVPSRCTQDIANLFPAVIPQIPGADAKLSSMSKNEDDIDEPDESKYSP